MNNVIISVPNQNLLKSEIDNYGHGKIIRRKCSVTVGYNMDDERVRELLLRVAGDIERVLKEPEPFVRVNAFEDYGITFTLYFFIKDVKILKEVEAQVRERIFEISRDENIDLSIPLLHQKID